MTNLIWVALPIFALVALTATAPAFLKWIDAGERNK
ncbi:hypothetical protein DFP78_113175 [Photobacterium lutimaris]|nr:hypothetical protein DFP78_113175 [Photobacterium lutimaris]